MAPANERIRRGGASSGRPHHNANTHAGVNRHRSTALRASTHTRGSQSRPARAELPRPSANARAGPSLLSRMTYDRGRGGDNYRASTRPRPHQRPQHGVRLQDRITRDEDHVPTEVGVNVVNRTEAHMSRTERHFDEQDDHASRTSGRIGIHPPSNNHNNTIHPTVPAPRQNIPPSYPLNPNFLSLAPYLPSPPPNPHPTAHSTRPIRMFNTPVPKHPLLGTAAPSIRPVNTYRGKDPIKRLVQNPKLQAILSDKPIPEARKKHKDEMMELRRGVGGF